ncbi:hypothetical protein M440DRAFT_1170899 [Trichoderma longibrachiatum ATCC 18648]|uniref:Uncharacterized protein n=1 Tax=Trichoderma longibrachiatum ATCC 18648 TaxID=983965 RepID=A0A2T4CD66_TRILO|nr:hypothetical protein M440DRAFT_1170899 [Trichoderma longibrachiatum ATCC 18648]
MRFARDGGGTQSAASRGHSQAIEPNFRDKLWPASHLLLVTQRTQCLGRQTMASVQSMSNQANQLQSNRLQAASDTRLAIRRKYTIGEIQDVGYYSLISLPRTGTCPPPSPPIPQLPLSPLASRLSARALVTAPGSIGHQTAGVSRPKTFPVFASPRAAVLGFVLSRLDAALASFARATCGFGEALSIVDETNKRFLRRATGGVSTLGAGLDRGSFEMLFAHHHHRHRHHPRRL